MQRQSQILLVNEDANDDSVEELVEMGASEEALQAYNLGNQAYRNQQFKKAIQYYNVAIKENCSHYLHHAWVNRAAAYQILGDFCTALNQYLAVANVQPYYSVKICDAIRTNISILFDAIKISDLNAISKDTIMELINLFPRQEQIPYLIKCLIKNDPLGERMWQLEFPWIECSLETGILKLILDRLIDILDTSDALTIGAAKAFCNTVGLPSDIGIHLASFLIQDEYSFYQAKMIEKDIRIQECDMEILPPFEDHNKNKETHLTSYFTSQAAKDLASTTKKIRERTREEIYKNTKQQIINICGEDIKEKKDLHQLFSIFYAGITSQKNTEENNIKQTTSSEAPSLKK
jgi:tetratricopeptide (TPR) repeat protein